MLKIIHSNFQIDLSDKDISIVEENQWFSDRFFTNYTLPFNLYITDELNVALGDILSFTSASENTYFDVYLYHNGQENRAIFEIEEIEGREASCSVRFGLDELPNYNKKLSELALEDFEIEAPETIQTYAETIIKKTWPEVSHNFVMAHIDKLDKETDQWAAFEGVLNKRVEGAFVTNSYDAEDDLQLNRNIMQPQPYLMYVLEKAVEDAGFELAGDVLEDPKLKIALFSEISEYYHTINAEGIEFYMHNQESHVPVEGPLSVYTKSISLTEKGRYKIAGNITLRSFVIRALGELKYNGKRIWRGEKRFNKDIGWEEFTIPININVDFFTGSSATLEFWSENFNTVYLDNSEWSDAPAPIMDLTITQLSKLDSSGKLMPTLITPNKIKLSKCVPDITVGEFMTIIKNWKNFDFVPQGNLLYMNYIENQLLTTTAKDMRGYEIKNPVRRSNRGKSFLLKFQDVNSEDYKYDSVFVDINGVFLSDYKLNDDTSEIVINALPLPITSRDNIVTAHHFVDDQSKIKVILYEGAPDIENVAQDNYELLIPQIHEKHYKEWLLFRLNSKSYLWNFKIYEENMRDLLLRNKIFTYNNYHIIKSLNKDLVAPGLWQIEIETASLEHRV